MLKFHISKRNLKQVILLCADITFITLSIFLAMAIRYGELTVDIKEQSYYNYALTLVLSLILFRKLGLYSSIIRYMGQKAFITIIKAITLSSLILAITILMTKSNMPRSMPFIYWGIALFFVGGSRFFIWFHYQTIITIGRKGVAIYGAGAAGRQLLTSLQHGDKYDVRFFIDDNPEIKGRMVNGIKVYDFDALAELIDSEAITQLLLAIPSIGMNQRRKIIKQLEPFPIHVMSIPGTVDIVSGKAKLEELKEIDLDDLLGRESVSPNNNLFEKCIKDKVVFVSGAGGSIGSELCRQILKHAPSHIILFELSEYALYSISQELQQSLSLFEEDKAIKLTALLGSVQDKEKLEKIFKLYTVDTVYHAAAYKHVPIVEENVVAGIRNNIFGTQRAAEAASAAKVETFVLISTDKAVRPTNVMGATKRFAEMTLQALAEDSQSNHTRFCMVRFGNVLGSSGSVVPLFQKQIRQGGPVTVTHADIVRYFMTIPEAVQLVIQAGSLGLGGDVFVLDMGDPIQIATLAKKMIHLSGYEVKDEQNPTGDLEIVYTGLRPGEKLYEELLIGDNVSGTEHPRIMRAEEKRLALADINKMIDALSDACEHCNIESIRSILLQSEIGYAPDKDEPVDFLWRESQKASV